jgi:hypothetical protein
MGYFICHPTELRTFLHRLKRTSVKNTIIWPNGQLMVFFGRREEGWRNVGDEIGVSED